MNLILLKKEEISSGRAILNDRRARHIAGVLKPKAGEWLRVGILNGKAGTAKVESIDKGIVTLASFNLDKTAPAPWFDIMLAVPRPKVLHRLWAPLASLGVRQIILINAAKVEKCYFDTHWLNQDSYTPLLQEGLEQSCTTQMPSVEIIKAFKPFIEDQIPQRFPNSPKLVAQPRLNGNNRPLEPFTQNPPQDADLPLIAIGPEGGWTEFEFNLLEKADFKPLTLGDRALRTDIAIAAIAGALSGATVTANNSN